MRIFKIQLEKLLSQKILSEGGDPSKILFTENENATHQTQNQRLITLESQQTHFEKNELGPTTSTVQILLEDKGNNQNL